MARVAERPQSVLVKVAGPTLSDFTVLDGKTRDPRRPCGTTGGARDSFRFDAAASRRDT